MTYPDSTGSTQLTGSLQKLRATRQTIVLQVLALGLVALAVPLYLVFGQLRDDVTQTERQLTEVQANLTALSTPSAEVQQLSDQVAQTEALLDALATAPPPVGVDWPQLASAIAGYDAQKIVLVTLTEADNGIILEGRAVDNAAVVAYIKALSASPLFLDIERQSVRTVPAPDVTPESPSELSAELWPAHFVLNLVVNQL